MHQILRLPYLIAILGALISLLLWIILWEDIYLYSKFLSQLRPYLPWIILALSLSFSALIAALVEVAQVSRQRELNLNEMNINLIKEISERINAEETKQKLEVALLQGQKLQAIGTLAGGIAHDFNNILYAIIGYSEMAREDVPQNTLTHKNLGKVLEAAHRGQELVARILAFGRRQHHHFEVIDLKTTIEAALALLKPTIPASVMIEFQPINFNILGNQTLMHQVLVNIINNAVDAMDGEGDITISMSRLNANDPFLKQFPDIHSGNYCKIEIKDTGHGMDRSTAERIFEPFFTTKEVGKGTGLGLSIVHSIVKEHNGDIIVSSQLGRGTTFTLVLPEHTPS